MPETCLLCVSDGLKATGEVKDIFVHIACGHLSDWCNDINSRFVLFFRFSLHLCEKSNAFRLFNSPS